MKVSAVSSKICFCSNFTHFYNYMYGNCFTFNGATNISLVTTRTGPLYGRIGASRRALHTHARTHARTHKQTYKCLRHVCTNIIDVCTHIHATPCIPHVRIHARTRARSQARTHMHRACATMHATKRHSYLISRCQFDRSFFQYPLQSLYSIRMQIII